jgi:hypothetical protein
MGGTGVKVCKTTDVGVGVDTDRSGVGVINDCAVAVEAPWVDMELSVSAAEVYNAFKVAAGWGVAAASGAQARTKTSATSGIKSFLK